MDFKIFEKLPKIAELRKFDKEAKSDLYIYDPNLILEDYKPEDKNIKENLAKFCNLTTLMFDLIPFFSIICEDPMIDMFPEEK